MTTIKAKQATRTIGSHEFTLTVGRRYRAGRQMMAYRNQVLDVTITDLADGGIAAVVYNLSYDEANALLAAFNNGKTSFKGRVWR